MKRMDEGSVAMEKEESQEYRLLEAYCRRRELCSSLNTVVDCLADIADSAPFAEGNLKNEDSSPEQLGQCIKQNKVLQQQLQTGFSYSLFERVIATLQGCLSVGSAPPGASANEETRMRRKQIASAFEVTSRLSAVELIPKRRVLSFGKHFLHQHHSDWVQQHGGWDEVFSGEEID
ncbi:unnamed protein product [Merluccius merluccius]